MFLRQKLRTNYREILVKLLMLSIPTISIFLIIICPNFPTITESLISPLFPIKPGYAILEEELNKFAYVWRKAEIIFVYKGRLVAILPLYCSIVPVKTKKTIEIACHYAIASLKYASGDLIGIGFQNFTRHCIKKLPNLRIDITNISTPWFLCKPEYRFPYFKRYWLNFHGDLMWCEAWGIPLDEELEYKYFFAKMRINKFYLFFADRTLTVNITVEVYFLFEKLSELKWAEYAVYHVKVNDPNIVVYTYRDKLIINIDFEEYEVYNILSYEFFDY